MPRNSPHPQKRLQGAHSRRERGRSEDRNRHHRTCVIVPYNDFISEGGKIWDRIKSVAEANQCIPHMTQVLEAARESGIRVFYALHRRYRPGDYESWKYIAPVQKAAWSSKPFA